MLINPCQKYLLVLMFSAVQITLAQKKEDRRIIRSKTNIEKLHQLKNEFNAKYLNTLEEAKKLGIEGKLYAKGKVVGVLDEIKEGQAFYTSDDNYDAAVTSKVHKIWDGGSTGLNLTGKDIVIGHWENSGLPLVNHAEFNGRVQLKDAVGASSHATHTAGTMIAAGVDERARGMASEAIIHARNSENDEAEMAAFASEGGLLSNHSYGQTASSSLSAKYYGYYSESARDWDLIAYNAPYYLICKSAGNNRDNGFNGRDGGYDILLKKATAKNVLVIGAVKDVPSYSGPQSVEQTDFSSYGPTDDFRIKPDLMANGYKLYSADSFDNNGYDEKSGTSMATPVVTGIVALLQQLYYRQNSAYMRASTIKALLINSADELGGAPGPDFANGWGLLNAERAAMQIQQNKTTSLIVEETLENKKSFTKTVEVDGETPLLVTMAWTDAPGEPIPSDILEEDQSDSMLVNDLDIRITGNGVNFQPWTFPSITSFTQAAVRGDNFRDNVEKIEVEDIDPGTYTITVTHKGDLYEEEQDFSMIIDGVVEQSLEVDQSVFEKDKIAVFPNPTSGKIRIRSKDFQNQIGVVEVFDIKGSLLLKKKIVLEEEEIELKVAGIYFVKVMSGTFIKVEKIIVN